ncbi:MAG: sigma-54 dependent transcriptional regulator [Acidobacteriota bacterium]
MRKLHRRKGSPSAVKRFDEILVVEDDQLLRAAIATHLHKEGFKVEEAGTGTEGLEMLRARPFDVFLTDLKLPEQDGRQIVREAVSLYPEAVVIVMTGYGSIEVAVELMHLGATDFLSKPFELAKLTHRIRRALEMKRLAIENFILKKGLKDRYRFANMIGQCDPMREVFHWIERAMGTSSHVLVEGEPGAGKDMVARTIHWNGSRRDRPFVGVRCDLASESLLDQEIFGTAPDPATGVGQHRAGAIELAHRGTLLIDAIEALSPALQDKLARFIRSGRLERGSGARPVKTAVRIIALTCDELGKRVEVGAFHRGLYESLNAIHIEIPSLRERIEDLPMLARCFADQYSFEHGFPAKTIGQLAMQQLVAYHWPGNVRELENAVEQAVLLSGDQLLIMPEHFRAEIQQVDPRVLFRQVYVPREGLNFESMMDDFQRELITQGLKTAGGNRARAAELLHLKRTTLVGMMRRHCIDLRHDYCQTPPSRVPLSSGKQSEES